MCKLPGRDRVVSGTGPVNNNLSTGMGCFLSSPSLRPESGWLAAAVRVPGHYSCLRVPGHYSCVVTAALFESILAICAGFVNGFLITMDPGNMLGPN